MMVENDDCFEALDRVSGELRASQGRPLDWNRIESGLFLKIDAEDRAKQGRIARTIVPSGIWRALGFAAAAATVMMIAAATTQMPASVATNEVQKTRDGQTAPQARLVEGAALPPAAANGERELLALREGDVLEATGEALRFGHANVVSWSLERGSRAVVKSLGKDGVGNTITLEKGSIRAEVTPRPASEGLVEAFAVEVQGTRVAVHGTAFSVTRTDAGAIVDVEHGSVACGPVGHVGETNGRLLVGPSRALVSLDGARSAKWLDRTSAVVATRAAAPVDAAMPVAPNQAVAAVEAPSTPTAEDEAIASPPHVIAPVARVAEAAAPSAPAAPAVRELSSGVIAGQIERCINEVYGAPSSSLSFNASSSFQIKLHPDGSVKSAQFVPTLQPALAECMGRGAMAGRFPPGTSDLSVPVRLGK